MKGRVLEIVKTFRLLSENLLLSIIIIIEERERKTKRKIAQKDEQKP